MKLICYGDSNTYGFDPRGPIPGRYEADYRWCDCLAEITGWDVVNAGENGRIVPEPAWGYTDLKRTLSEHSDADSICIMLGTNDILISSRTDISPVVARMEALLDFLAAAYPQLRPILLTPPPFDIPDFPPAEGKRTALIEEYRRLAAGRNILLIDNSSWDIPLAYDGAHLSPKGHQIFAGLLAEELVRSLR